MSDKKEIDCWYYTQRVKAYACFFTLLLILKVVSIILVKLQKIKYY